MSSGIEQHKYAVALLEQQCRRKKRELFLTTPGTSERIQSIIDFDHIKTEIRIEKKQLTWLGRVG